ncbi:hypothetical protein ABH905_005719 [Pseudomonas frederiksbergensis]
MNASSVPDNATDDRFNEVLALIQSAKQQAMQAVNTQLIELYWQVGGLYQSQAGKGRMGRFGGQPTGRASGPDSGYVVLLAPICSACVSSTRLTGVTRKSHHWCDNCEFYALNVAQGEEY